MTEKETGLILLKLSAFYGEGKSNTELMVKSWHEILGEFDYFIAERAVREFAKNDTREYSAFPTPGAIYQAIADEEKIYNRIFNAITKSAEHLTDAKTEYEQLPEKAKRLITEDAFISASKRDINDLLNGREEFIALMKSADFKYYLAEKGE